MTTRRLVLPAQRLVFRLFEPHAWDRKASKGHFVSFRDQQHGDSLTIGAWDTDERATFEHCAERARLWREFPRFAVQLEQGHIDRPAGFDTRFEATSSSPESLTEALALSLVAFGGRGRRCFAMAFVVHAAGATDVDIERATDRLNLAKTVILGHLEELATATPPGRRP